MRLRHQQLLSFQGIYGEQEQLTELSGENLNDMEGIPEKARKGYAALSIRIGSRLQNKNGKNDENKLEIPQMLNIQAVEFDVIG